MLSRKNVVGKSFLEKLSMLCKLSMVLPYRPDRRSAVSKSQTEAGVSPGPGPPFPC